MHLLKKMTQTLCASLAQLAEQLTLNQWVPGSSPGGCTSSPRYLSPGAGRLAFPRGQAFPEGQSSSAELAFQQSAPRR